jgi:hypothetical protein
MQGTDDETEGALHFEIKRAKQVCHHNAGANHFDHRRDGRISHPLGLYEFRNRHSRRIGAKDRAPNASLRRGSAAPHT